MTKPNKEPWPSANDPMMAALVKWFRVQLKANSRAKKKADGELMNAIVLAAGDRMVRAQTTGERLPWEEELWKAADVSEEMREWIYEVFLKHPWRE